MIHYDRDCTHRRKVNICCAEEHRCRCGITIKHRTSVSDAWRWPRGVWTAQLLWKTVRGERVLTWGLTHTLKIATTFFSLMIWDKNHGICQGVPRVSLRKGGTIQWLATNTMRTRIQRGEEERGCKRRHRGWDGKGKRGEESEREREGRLPV